MTPPQPITKQKKPNQKTRLPHKRRSLQMVQEVEHSVERSGPPKSVDADGVAKPNSQTPFDQKTGDKDAVDDGAAVDNWNKVFQTICTS